MATPIGNLGDMTDRARDVLSRADLIAAEDTRSTQRLLTAFGLRPRNILAYHEHNADKARPEIMRRLKCGEAVAVASEAGAPLISDPGYKLVQAALAQDLTVTAIPGATALITALQVSGLPSDRFFFNGFLPPRSSARRKALAELQAISASLIFYETAPRLSESLADMLAVLGDRPAAIARELTKMFEEVRRGPISQLIETLSEGRLKGEIVLVVGGATTREGGNLDEASLTQMLAAQMKNTRLRDAVDAVAGLTGQPRRRIYDLALQLKKGD